MAFTNKWTAEKDALLKECIDKKMSARLTGDCLGVTHNSAIGRASRLGLHFDSFGSGGQQRFRPHAPVNGMTKPKRVNTVRALDFNFRQSDSVPVAPRQISEPAPEFLSLTLLELKNNSCRYPHGGDGSETFFCGQHQIEDSSYCYFHHKLSHQDGPLRNLSTFRPFQ